MIIVTPHFNWFVLMEPFYAFWFWAKPIYIQHHVKALKNILPR